MATKTCPHLGRRDDPSTLFNYPSVGNYCHHVRPLAPPHEEHQAQYCLSGQFQQCPVYQIPAGKHLPPSLQLQTQEWDEPVAPPLLNRFPLRQWGILLALGIIILLSAILYVFVANWDTLIVPASPVLTSTLIPTHPLPTLTPFPLGGPPTLTNPTSNLPELTPTRSLSTTLPASPTQDLILLLPSPTNCLHPADWVWYTIQPGDTLSSISRVTGVSVSQLQQANCMGSSTQLITGQNLSVPILPVFPTTTQTTAPSPEPFTAQNTATPSPTYTPADVSTEALNPPRTPTETISPGS